MKATARKGKHMWIDFDSGPSLMLHFGRTFLPPAATTHSKLQSGIGNASSKLSKSGALPACLLLSVMRCHMNYVREISAQTMLSQLLGFNRQHVGSSAHPSPIWHRTRCMMSHSCKVVSIQMLAARFGLPAAPARPKCQAQQAR